MNRATAAVGIVDVERLDLAFVELVFGQDAVFLIGLEEDDGGIRVRARCQAAFWARVRS